MTRPPASRLRRSAPTALLAASIGVAATFISAWALADGARFGVSSRHGTSHLAMSNGVVLANTMRTFGAARLDVRFQPLAGPSTGQESPGGAPSSPPAPQSAPIVSASAVPMEHREERHIRRLASSYANEPMAPSQDAQSIALSVTLATRSDFVEWAGWPCFAFESEVCGAQSLPNDPPLTASAGLLTRYGTRTYNTLNGCFTVSLPPDDRLATLPFRPAWPGFFVNSLLFGAVAWLLLVTTTAAYRAIAHRRARRAGRCPHCRYDRRGLEPAAPCPECGHTLPNNPTPARFHASHAP